MRRFSWPATLLLVVLVANPSGAAGTAESRIWALYTSEPGRRFEAVLDLVNADQTGLDRALTAARELPEFGEETEARTALDFVIHKRAGTVFEPVKAKRSLPNVLLISIDTLRPDHLGCYGHARDTSPRIDALARSGATFLQAISPSSWTLPSHMSILTSLYPSFHKLEFGRVTGSMKLDSSVRTLTQELHEAGYRTAALVAHPFLDASWGFDRGFDLYLRFTTRADAQSRRAALWLEWHRFRVQREKRPTPAFFLFLHYLDPHEPYDAPPPYGKRFVRDYDGPLSDDGRYVTEFMEKPFPSPKDLEYVEARYDAEIRFVDEQLGLVLDTLENLGWSDSTLIVVTSDHGEEFKDHDAMGHKHTLYDEQLRVPLVLSYPKGIQAAQRIREPVSLLDIHPTILELSAGASVKQAQGRSLVPLLRSDGDKNRRSESDPRDLFAELGPLGKKWERDFYRRVVRTDRLKLIYNYAADGGLKKELYNLHRDADERSNVYASQSDEVEVQRLEARLDAFIRAGPEHNAEFLERNEIEIDPELLEKLRALGYIK